MKIKDESYSVVLVGKWNKYILSPEWSAGNIFNVERLQVEFGINVGLPSRYSANNIRMVPTDDAVVFSALAYDDDTLALLEELPVSLLQKLKFTPIVACGINFGFSENIEDTDVSELFNFSDNSKLIEMGCVIDSNSISRSLMFGDKQLNLNISQLDSKVNFEFNFHYDVKSVDAAITCIRDFKHNKDLVFEILTTKYNLALED